MASTTQLWNPVRRAWSECVQSAAGVPPRIFPPVVPPCTRLGALSAAATDSWKTSLTCEPPPPGPPAPEPLPPVPPTPPDLPDDESLAPGGITPPKAGVAGVAAVGRLPACIRRGSVVSLRVSRAASASVFVGDRRIHGLSIRPLQSPNSTLMPRAAHGVGPSRTPHRRPPRRVPVSPTGTNTLSRPNVTYPAPVPPQWSIRSARGRAEWLPPGPRQ